jgi:hypothetical protein
MCCITPVRGACSDIVDSISASVNENWNFRLRFLLPVPGTAFRNTEVSADKEYARELELAAIPQR